MNKESDLSQTFEERIEPIKKILPTAADDLDLLKKYVKIQDSKFKSHCPIDDDKMLFALGLSHVFRYGKEVVEKSITPQHYALGNLICRCIDYMKENKETAQIAEDVYKLQIPRIEEYLHRYGLKFIWVT